MLFDLGHLEIELGSLAGDRGGIIGRKLCCDRLAFSGCHADQGLFDLRQHAVGADDHGESLALAAGKDAAVDAAFVVERDAISLLRGSLHLGEHRALRAHALEHGFDILFGDTRRRPLDRNAVERVEHHLGHHLEDGGIAQLIARAPPRSARCAGRQPVAASAG